MEKEEVVLEGSPKSLENGKQFEPTHYALPVDAFDSMLKRIHSFPYAFARQIQEIEELIKSNVVGVSITKTNTNDKQNQTTPESK